MTTKEQRIQEARLRMISRQRKEDEDVQNMFGLPIDREELTVDLTTLLGFAYITQPSDHWVYEVGSFHISGVYSLVSQIL